MAFFYKAKPRQFNYSPRYYDSEKERRSKRREELLGKRIEDGDYEPGSIIRGGGMRAKARFNDPEYRRRAERGQRTRLIVLLALMLGIVAFILFW